MCSVILLMFIIIPYIFYYVKVIRQFECFTENLLMGETIGCRPGYNSWQPEVCWKSGFFPFRACIFYTENYFVVLCKTKHSNYKDLKVSFSIITVIAFILGEHPVGNRHEVVSLGLTASGKTTTLGLTTSIYMFTTFSETETVDRFLSLYWMSNLYSWYI